jgi:hypothetical protein
MNVRKHCSEFLDRRQKSHLVLFGSKNRRSHGLAWPECQRGPISLRYPEHLSHMLRGRLLIIIHSRERAASALKPVATSLDLPSLWVKDTLSPFGSLDDSRILLDQSPVILLGLPIPNTVSSEEEIHFFKCALIRLRVQCPDDWDGDDVDRCVDVVRLLLDVVEHCLQFVSV